MKQTIKSILEEMRSYIEQNNLTRVTGLKYNRKKKSFDMLFNGLPLSYSTSEMVWEMLKAADK